MGSKNRKLRHNSYKAKYGITVKAYNRQLARQANACAICGKGIQPDAGEVLDVDHDHVTGQVRGLLCRGCNQGLGRFCDDPDLLLHAAKYLCYHTGHSF